MVETPQTGSVDGIPNPAKAQGVANTEVVQTWRSDECEECEDGVECDAGHVCEIGCHLSSSTKCTQYMIHADSQEDDHTKHGDLNTRVGVGEDSNTTSMVTFGQLCKKMVRKIHEWIGNSQNLLVLILE